MKLLISTNLNLTDIAFECGYSAPRYFGKYFREFVGISPTDFRKQFGNGVKNHRKEELAYVLPYRDVVALIEELAFPLKNQIIRKTHYIEINAHIQGSSYQGQRKKNRSSLKIPSIIPKCLTNRPEISEDLKRSIELSQNFLYSLSKEGRFRHKKTDATLWMTSSFYSCCHFVEEFIASLGHQLLMSSGQWALFREGTQLQILSYTPFSLLENGKNLERSSSSGNRVSLKITGIETSVRVDRHRVNKDNGSIYHLWEKMGYPRTLSPNEQAMIQRILHPEVSFDLQQPPLRIELNFTHPGVELFIITPQAIDFQNRTI